VGDLDVLVGTDAPGAIVSRFLRMPGIAKVLVSGEGRSSVRLEGGRQIDIRLIPPESFGAGLHYFTGSQAHNIAVRIRGNRRGLKISEKGIYRRGDDIRVGGGEHEEAIFAAIGLPWIPPELRENLGELEAAVKGQLPDLVAEDQIRGDLHLHLTGDDETASHMVRAAFERSLSYVALCDFARTKQHEEGLDSSGALRRLRALRRLEDQLGQLHILAGIEVSITVEGDLDFNKEVLRKHDWVVASVQSHFEAPAEEMTRRIVRAMESGLVDCIGHPTSAFHGERKACGLDMHRIVAIARKTGVALEVNGEPRRMDLDGQSCRTAKEGGAMLTISSHAHRPSELGNVTFALAAARRGWVEAKEVLNSREVEDVARFRKSRLRRFGFPVPRPLARLRGQVSGGPVDGHLDELDLLTSRLQTGPLDEELRDRIHRYLTQGDDLVLDRALRRLSDNPLKVAMELYVGAE
jgi:DNA polymerase (family 10)